MMKLLDQDVLVESAMNTGKTINLGTFRDITPRSIEPILRRQYLQHI
jgi:hypothetical protein